MLNGWIAIFIPGFSCLITVYTKCQHQAETCQQILQSYLQFICSSLNEKLLSFHHQFPKEKETIKGGGGLKEAKNVNE